MNPSKTTRRCSSLLVKFFYQTAQQAAQTVIIDIPGGGTGYTLTAGTCGSNSSSWGWRVIVTLWRGGVRCGGVRCGEELASFLFLTSPRGTSSSRLWRFLSVEERLGVS